MRKLTSPKLLAVLAMCCFLFFFRNFKSSYFGPSGELVETGKKFDVPDRQEEEKELRGAELKGAEVKGAEPVNPTRKRIQAIDMSSLDRTLNFSARPDVPTQTPWYGPIMWEGMFDGAAYDTAHREANSSVALTVFAIGRYLEAYLKNFIISAEKHFMIGIPLTYYIFTDTPEDVPDFVLGPERTMKVLYAQGHSRWQDISMMRMKTLSQIIDEEISYKHPYIFCLDVDSVFEARFGTEALGESVTVLHSYYYTVKQEAFTYDRNPKSRAYMETGDYYYHAALFGGTWPNVKALVEYCYEGIMEDKKNNVEALWHDESHLNKYYWLHKPTKLLSPEYSWDAISLKDRKEIRVSRMIWAKKHYDVLRG